MNIIAQTLSIGGTVYNKSAARITGDKVGAENYAQWKSAMTTAHDKFYRYAKAVDDVAHGKTVDVAQAKTAGMNALQVILDLIGEINDHSIVKTEEMFCDVVKYAVAERTELVGHALLVKSQYDNAKARLKDLDFNGVNPDAVAQAEQRVAELEEELKLAKKDTNSGKPYDTKSSFNAFCCGFERKMAKWAHEQAMKSAEELEAEAEARKAERKARRQAKRQAEAAAKAAENAAA